jgi:hypothetical protein
MMPILRRAILVLSLSAFGLTACGEAGPLDGVGELSSDWIRGDETTTTTIEIQPAGIGFEALVRATDVLWFNDDIEGQATGSPAVVVTAVWDRRLGSRFVQASRAEIATALPTVRFPESVPSSVRWVTSQLVYDEDAGDLDVDTVVAFGLWQAEPYTLSEAQVAVLRIGVAPPETGPGRSDIVPFIVSDGVSLVWTDAGLRYELFCRSTVSEELCTEVAESSTLLSGLLPATGPGA